VLPLTELDAVPKAESELPAPARSTFEPATTTTEYESLSTRGLVDWVAQLDVSPLYVAKITPFGLTIAAYQPWVAVAVHFAVQSGVTAFRDAAETQVALGAEPVRPAPDGVEIFKANSPVFRSFVTDSENVSYVAVPFELGCPCPNPTV
jgi:hypothetical protein